MDESGRDQVEPLGLEPTTTVRTRRPRALWAVLAAVAVATGALVVTSADGDGGQRPGLPVALGSGATPMAAEAAADSMLAWITYVPGDDLPALGGETPAYRLSGTVSEDQVRSLADALGLDGEVARDGGAWRVSGDGGTLEVYEGAGAQWWYTSASAGGGTSSFGGGSSGSVGDCSGDDPTTLCLTETSTPTTFPECGATDGVGCFPADCDAGADCAVPLPAPAECPPNAECSGPARPVPPADCPASDSGIVACEQLVDPPVDCAANPPNTPDLCRPEPPADLPSEEEARSIALELLTRTGMDVDDAVVTTDGPYEAWYVMVEPRLDGLPSGLLANVSVGSGDQVTSAGGYLGTPERLGDYPRLDTRATIDRANAQQAVSFGDATTGLGMAESAVGDPYPPEQAPVPDQQADAPPLTAPCNPDGDPADPGSAACDTLSEPTTTTTLNVTGCKVQPDGREICEPIEPGIACPQAAAPADEPLGAPETLECTPPPVDPGIEPIPMPEPQPLEIVLVDAAASLLLLPAIDGSNDAYLVPGYRFTDEQGGTVDLPAVDDASLTGPPSTETTVPPDTVQPSSGVVDPTDPCEVAVEDDASGTTHTIQTCPPPSGDPVVLTPDEAPVTAVAYYVDVDTTCHGGSFVLGQQTWNIDEGDTTSWSSPHEGGTFTLEAPDRGRFVGDAEGAKVATFRPRSPEAEYSCEPVPRP